MGVEVLEERPPPAATKPWWPLVVALVVGVAVIALIGIFVANETSSLGTSTTGQVTAVRQACDQWAASERADAASSCSAMADWMGRQVAEGHVAGHTMWGDAGAMAGSCIEWASTASEETIAGRSASAWCDGMAAWMEGHVGDWGRWMQQGRMMGGT
jgi:hypothetical protein